MAASLGVSSHAVNAACLCTIPSNPHLNPARWLPPSPRFQMQKPRCRKVEPFAQGRHALALKTVCCCGSCLLWGFSELPWGEPGGGGDLGAGHQRTARPSPLPVLPAGAVNTAPLQSVFVAVTLFGPHGLLIGFLCPFERWGDRRAPLCDGLPSEKQNRGPENRARVQSPRRRSLCCPSPPRFERTCF